MHPHRPALAALLLFAGLLALSPHAQAKQGDEEPQDQLTRAAATDSGSGWLFGGGLAVSDPGYVGYTRQVTPVPLVFYHNGRFFFAGFTAGYVLAGDEQVRLSLVAKPEFNRLSSSDSPELAGIQSRQWSIDGGANLDVFESWGHLNLGLFHDLLDRNNGTQANLGYQYFFHAGDWTLAPGFGLRWQNGNYDSYYYGVSPAEVIPGRPAYSPGSSTNPYVSFGVSTAVSDHWQFRGAITYLRFGSAVHDSPIIDRSGSPTLFIGFVYNPADKQ